MVLCIFCASRQATGSEHVVLNALGGRRETVGLLCVDCNPRFGGGIDAKLEGALRYFSAVAGCFRGDGDPVAPAYAEIQGAVGHLRVEHGGRATRGHQVEMTLVSADGTRSTKQMVRFEEGAIAGFIASSAKKLNIPFEEIHLEGTVRENGVEQSEISGGFGGPEQFRCVAKMGLAAQAHRHGLRATNPRTKRLAAWVKGGTGDWPFALDPGAGPAFRAAAASSVGQHILAVFEGPTRRWEVAFVAFGVIAYRLELPRPRAGFAPLVHVVDPRARTHEVRAFTSPELRSIRDVFLSAEYGQAAIDELMAWTRSNAAEAVARQAAEATAGIDVTEIMRLVREHMRPPT